MNWDTYIPVSELTYFNDDEESRFHPWFENIAVTNHGRVFSCKRQYWYELSQSVGNHGYYMVGAGGKSQLVHRLVAQTFVYNPYPDIQNVVDHLDDDKLYNSADNLEWVTQKENNRRAWESGLAKAAPVATPIRIVETGEVFRTQVECAAHVGGHQGGIAHCLGTRRNMSRHKGYHYEYVTGADYGY